MRHRVRKTVEVISFYEAQNAVALLLEVVCLTSTLI